MKTLNFQLLNNIHNPLKQAKSGFVSKELSYLFPPLSSGHQKDKPPQYKRPKSQPCKKVKMKCQKTGKQTGVDGWRPGSIKLSIKLSLLGAVTIDLFWTALRSFYREGITVFGLGREG